MRATTKLQVQVVELSSRLPKITQKQSEWAYQNCLEHRAYSIKSRVLCLDCGETFAPELVSRKKAVCPHCSTKVQVKELRYTTDKQTNYFAITAIVDEFQVVRNFELIAQYKKGNPAKYHLHEILQYWIRPDGKITMFGKSHNSSWCMDSWSGTMEIRHEGKGYGGNKYDVYARLYHPDSKIKKEYSKYGIDRNLSGISFLNAIETLEKNTKAETLLKAKQYSLLGYCSGSNTSNISRYWNSIKICLRNKYKVIDTSMYFDYLDLLSYFKKDLRNAKYVCPINLKAEHDRLMNKKREIIRLQEIERERIKIEKRQENLENAIVQYIARNQKFFNLEFKKGNITINVLQSVEEFKQEGDELKHCVYTNEYYLKEQSLILSAKVNGKRAETIEVLIPDIKIEQSRGLDNKSTEYHNKIIDLLNKNLNQIRNIVIKTRPRGKGKAAA